jgi:tetratricopeptide (TPR) repeat protein
MSVFRKHSTSIRIGELLVLAGVLTQAQMSEATRHSGSKRLQIGQILVMYGYLNARDLQVALDAQASIRDKSVDVDAAVRCLKIAIKTETSFNDVLQEQTGLGQSKAPPDKLGQLLYEAGVVTKEQLSLAMQRSLSTGLPLGHMLGLDNVVSDSLLTTALAVQTRLRDEMMTRNEAIRALRDAAGLVGDAAHSDGPGQIAFQQPRKRGVRLGEMMVLAGLLTDTDVMNALEWGLINNQPIGHVLAKKANLKQDVIDAALGLQLLVDQGKIDAVSACQHLAKIAATGISVEQAIADSETPDDDSNTTINYRQLLTLSRVISDEDFEAAFDFSTKSPQVIGKFLSAAGYMDGATIRATLKCQYLLSKGLMSQDDAVATLDYCLHHRPGKTIDYDAALNELGWSSKSPLKLSGELGGPQTRKISEKSEAAIEASLHNKKTAGKHSQTISPADRSASQIYNILAGQGDGDNANANSELATNDDALIATFSRLAQSYSEQGNYTQSQLVYERILVDRLNKLGPNDEKLVGDLKNLAGVLCCQGKFNQAETFMRRTIAILESHRIQEDPELCDVLSILSGIYYRQEKFAEAEPLAERVVRMQEIANGESMHLVDALNDLAKVLRKLGKREQAERVYDRAQALSAVLDDAEALLRDFSTS